MDMQLSYGKYKDNYTANKITKCRNLKKCNKNRFIFHYVQMNFNIYLDKRNICSGLHKPLPTIVWQVKSSQVKSSQVKSSQVMSSQVKSNSLFKSHPSHTYIKA